MIKREPWESTGFEAATVLGRYGRLGVPAAPALLDVLRDAGAAPAFRGAAAIALGKVGPSLEAVPAALAAAWEGAAEGETKDAIARALRAARNGAEAGAR